ncbi:class I SAM-dependent methyltransferase [Leptospira biflexa]|uniref:class I SAM-dependent DNA methyltransferase n=1 Tax=Leptospira biflexa TaxID=172 RepID=UPI0010845D8E|nr:class I SAM-dependent methyltransferase [Leptospira biflexa]TGM31740.1 class I SAM-dependent methyltransferase [Leptospira biflexa]TGM39101.1 class I SAM-dependent methyltransferase [Leptospira biflexa]TGM44512.1 class I SAM-dependent methyltransferase [Leptospira biflexa]
MSVFSDYSIYYDLLYKDKDYAGESQYVLNALSTDDKQLNSLLELGCGTGKHAEFFLQKFNQYKGVDLSEDMVMQAKDRLAGKNVDLSIGDVRNFKSNEKFDAVVSLFHVASYQIENHDFLSYLKSANENLKSGSLFLFDFWYGPAVLNLKPSIKIKRMSSEKYLVTRIAEPTCDPQRNLVIVNYEVLIEDKANHKHSKIIESHPMRYYFIPEIKYFLEMSGFDVNETRFEEWMTAQVPSENSWGVTCITRKK